MRYLRLSRSHKFSISKIEKLNQKELIKLQKSFQELKEYINHIFGKENYDSLKESNKEIKKAIKVFNLLESDFKELLPYIKIKKKYYVKMGIFGNISTASETTFISCANDDLSNKVLKRLKDFCDLGKKLSVIKDQNLEINKAAIGLVNDYGFDMGGIAENSDIISHNLKPRKFLDLIKTDLIEETRGLSVQEEGFWPGQIYGHDKFWRECIEVSKKEFTTKSYGTHGFLIGNFFYEYIRLIELNMKNFEIQEIIDEKIVKKYRIASLGYIERALRKIELTQRSKVRSKSLSENHNSIYVLSNKMHPQIYKIGWTSLLPEERAEQLSSETGVLYPFKVIYKKKFKNAEKIEKKIHRFFAEKRVRRNKEYFEVDFEKIKNYIDKIKV